MIELDLQMGPRGAVKLFRAFDNLFLRVRVEPGGIRDLIVRGRPEEAVDRILELEKELEEILANLRQRFREGPTINEVLEKSWLPQMRLALDESRRAEAIARSGNPGNINLREHEMRLEGYWRSMRVNLIQVGYDWAAPEILEHNTYMMALAKMELAIRFETRLPGPPDDGQKQRLREMYQSATFWFERYQNLVATRRTKQWETSARDLLAQCRARQVQFGGTAARP
jgi:hypothetical protein